jgi:diguanylate cyclase (GGDEF)-like protein
MPRMHLDFSGRGWGRVIAMTVVGTLFCIAVALWIDSFNWPGMQPDERERAIATDFIVPIVLAVPIIFFLTSKLRELTIARDKLAVYASTDALTGVLNRAAFTTLVEAYLAEVRAAEEQTRGALLVLDADNFKAINDRFGHDCGDDALKLIAGTIRSSIRSPDLVGRIGGEEFAIFLPASNPDHAGTVAERIRHAVSDAAFAPGGAPYHLSVSIGGTVFVGHVAYDELFHLADQQLYAAKQAGRDRTVISPLWRSTAMRAVA